MLKPGIGLVDAPRAFSIKLAGITSAAGLQPSTVDPEMCLFHRKEGLVMMMTKHVDDFKIAGDRSTVLGVLEKLQETFGELKIERDDFVNCGIHTFSRKTTRSHWTR